MVAIVYLHGFNSSPHSVKARQLGDYLRALPRAPAYHVPALPHRPAQAIAATEALLGRLERDSVTLVGSSLGGYYATYLAERHGCRAVLVNPTTRPFDDLRAYLGEQRNLYTGEAYELTAGHVEELAALRVERITRPERYLLLVEAGDEVLDYRLALAFYRGALQYVRGGGEHGYEGFREQIPAILTFAGLPADALAEPERG